MSIGWIADKDESNLDGWWKSIGLLSWKLSWGGDTFEGVLVSPLLIPMEQQIVRYLILYSCVTRKMWYSVYKFIFRGKKSDGYILNNIKSSTHTPDDLSWLSPDADITSLSWGDPDMNVLSIRVDLVGNSWYSVRLDTMEDTSEWSSGTSWLSLMGLSW